MSIPETAKKVRKINTLHRLGADFHRFAPVKCEKDSGEEKAAA